MQSMVDGGGAYSIYDLRFSISISISNLGFVICDLGFDAIDTVDAVEKI